MEVECAAAYSPPLIFGEEIFARRHLKLLESL